MLREDLTGKVFGRLTVLYYSHSKNRKAYWACQCSCGIAKFVQTQCLKSGNTSSCGCYKKESPTLNKVPTIVRFWKSIERQPSGCWKWTGRTVAGYGRLFINGKDILAHRLIMEWVKGPIPEGLVIDHVCRNTLCVNPDPQHLEIVTQHENIMRGIGVAAQHAKSNHCPRGHEYDASFVWKGQTARYCRQCKREQMKAHRARKRAA